MKNVIYNICEKLRGYSSEEEHFEVLAAECLRGNLYSIRVQVVDAKTKEMADESNE